MSARAGRRQFLKCPLKPLASGYTAPARGWYHIYTYDLGSPDPEALRWQEYFPDETLALVRMQIGTFRDGAIDDAGLSYAEAILQTFAEHGKEVILRVCYDLDGNGWAHEPDTFAAVCLHLRQTAALAAAHAQDICIAQGLLIGSWGEMHDTRYGRPQQIAALAQIWQEVTGGCVPLAVRTPAFLRQLPEQMSAGLFDDALCSDATHMGTFGADTREEELAYLRTRTRGVPTGGEALYTTRLSARETLRQMEELRVSYLNSVYDRRRLDEWKTLRTAHGRFLYDEIGERLGYRLTVSRADWRGGKLSLVLRNDGFAPLCQEAKLYARVGSECVCIPCALDDLGCGQRAALSAAVDGMGVLSLMLVRKKDGRAIPFANQGAGERLVLGELAERR